MSNIPRKCSNPLQYPAHYWTALLSHLIPCIARDTTSEAFTVDSNNDISVPDNWSYLTLGEQNRLTEKIQQKLYPEIQYSNHASR